MTEPTVDLETRTDNQSETRRRMTLASLRGLMRTIRGYLDRDDISNLLILPPLRGEAQMPSDGTPLPSSCATGGCT